MMRALFFSSEKEFNKTDGLALQNLTKRVDDCLLAACIHVSRSRNNFPFSALNNFKTELKQKCYLSFISKAFKSLSFSANLCYLVCGKCQNNPGNVIRVFFLRI